MKHVQLVLAVSSAVKIVRKVGIYRDGSINYKKLIICIAVLIASYLSIYAFDINASEIHKHLEIITSILGELA